MSKYNRSKSSGGVEYNTIQFYRNGQAAWTNSQLVSNDTRTMLGYDIANYHRRKRGGELLPHTAFHEEIHDSTVGWFSYYSLGYQDTLDTAEGQFIYFDDWQASAVPIYTDVKKANDFLVQKAASKIYSRGHDTLTFLAELRKTVALFRELNKTLAKLLELGSSKGITNLADLWLQFRYGWRTLYFDMMDLNEVINELDVSKKRFSERVGTSVSGSNSETLDFPIDVNHTRHDAVSDNWTVSRRGFVTADITPPKFQFNPITTSWELVKFSFIIDWFIDVGTWLESLSFLTIAENYEASSGYHLDVSRQVAEWGSHTTSYTYNFSGSSSSNIVVKHREPASLSYQPQTNINLDVAKIADILAILNRFR